MAKTEYCHCLLFRQFLNLNPAQPCDSTTGCGTSRCNSGGVGDKAQPSFENQNRWESVGKTRLVEKWDEINFISTFLFAGPAPGEQASVECVAWGAGRLYSCGLHGQVVYSVHVHCSWVD